MAEKRETGCIGGSDIPLSSLYHTPLDFMLCERDFGGHLCYLQLNRIPNRQAIGAPRHLYFSCVCEAYIISTPLFYPFTPSALQILISSEQRLLSLCSTLRQACSLQSASLRVPFSESNSSRKETRGVGGASSSGPVLPLA